MELINSGFFHDLDDDQETPSGWSFSNANVAQELTDSKAQSKSVNSPKKRNRPTPTISTAEVSFGELGLAKPLAKACESLGYSGPTEIQQKAIPLIIKGKDVLISAETGSGKTAAFGLPLLQRMLCRNKRLQATRALVLSPARELAQQTHSMIQTLAQNTDIRCGVIMGGANSAMEHRLLASSPDILIGTPGRILDHLLNSQGINLDYVEFLVLDEADRLLEMGFKSEIEKIISELPHGRQTVLASATLNQDVDSLANLALKHPVKVGRQGTPSGLKQVIINLEEDCRRENVVVALLKHHVSEEVIIFFRTKQDTHKMYLVLDELGMAVCELHGGMLQGMRLQSLRQFQSGEKNILVATDVAARGLDLPVKTVINVNMPNDPKKLMHRAGRTARAGKTGLSITLCNQYEKNKIKKIVKKAVTSLKVKPEHVEEAKELIKSTKDGVALRLEQEGVDQELDMAERENRHAMNLIIHADEIYNKPKKRWIRKETEITNPPKQQTANEKPKKKGSSNDVMKKMLSNPLMVKYARQSAKGIGMIQPKDKKKPKGKKGADSSKSATRDSKPKGRNETDSEKPSTRVYKPKARNEADSEKPAIRDSRPRASSEKPMGRRASSEKPIGRRGESSEKPMGRRGSEKPMGRKGSSSEKPFGRRGESSEKPIGRRGASLEKPMGRRGSSSEKPMGRRGSSSEKPMGRRGESSEKPMGRRGESSEKPMGRRGESSGKPMGRRGESSGKPMGRRGASSGKPMGRRGASSGKPMGRRGESSGKPMGRRDSKPKTARPSKLKDMKMSKGGKSFNTKKRYKRR